MNSKRQTGFSHILAVVIILVVVIIGLLGYIFWQNFIVKNSEPVAVDDTSQRVEDTAQQNVAEQTGTIVGSLTYPSEAIPPSIEIHAVNIETGKEYTTKEHLKESQYRYGTGYRIEVPTGHYNVYGTIESWPGMKAYYNQRIACGLKAECEDATKIELVVEANKDTIDATVGDWWGGEQ